MIKKMVSVIAAVFALFYFYTSGFGIFSTTSNLAMFILGISMLAMLTKPMRKGRANAWWMDVIDMVILIGLMVSILYWFFEFPVYGRERAGWPNQADLIMGGMLIILTLEVTRRMLGWVLPLLGIVMLAIIYFSPHLPGMFHHRGVPLRMIITFIYYTDGIFGTVTGTFAVFVMPFLIFGAFLKHTGGGEFFIRLCTGVAGKVAGGPALIAVLGSAVFGSISGSPISNVMTTGHFTIPLMKSVGYKPEMAAAVETSASLGGSFLPPIMGAAAFILATSTGTPYATIMAMAIVPSILYFIAVGVQVYWYARRHDLGRMDEVPDWRAEFKKGWYYLGAIVAIAAGVLMGYSIPRTAFFGCIFLLVCSFFRKETRLINISEINASAIAVFALVIATLAGFILARHFGHITIGVFILAVGLLLGIVLAVASKDVRRAFGRFKKPFDMFVDAGRDSIMVGSTAGTLGIVMAGITLHGLGLNFSALLLNISQGNVFITLILVSILGLILGMGLTITAAYIVLSIMAAPALVGVGIDLVVAHMICFWLSMTSALTPPIAIAAIVSAGIAKARPMMTAWHSMMLGVFLYLIPFTMAYAPQILVLGHTVLEVVDIIVSYVIVAIALASATQGWMFRNLRLWERVVFGATIPILMWASVITTLIGLAMFFAFAMFLYIDVKRTADTAPTATA